MVVTVDPAIKLGNVYQVKIVLIAGKTRSIDHTTFNLKQQDVAIRRVARKLKIPVESITQVDITMTSELGYSSF